jgi:hypothetical protein
MARDIRLSQRTRLSVGAGLSWADQRYMAARFGISPAAAERSGLPALRPRGRLARHGVQSAPAHRHRPSMVGLGHREPEPAARADHRQPADPST